MSAESDEDEKETVVINKDDSAIIFRANGTREVIYSAPVDDNEFVEGTAIEMMLATIALDYDPIRKLCEQKLGVVTIENEEPKPS